MKHPGNLAIKDFTYELPAEKIALKPLPERDASRLLIYRDGNICEDIYRNIHTHLHNESLLVFNNSRVINARLRFTKSTGTPIEIFCLEPHEAINDYATVLAKKASVTWKCLVGGVAKWKEESLFKKWETIESEVVLEAILVERLVDACLVKFSWEPARLSFAEILEMSGDIPLPPYIKRKPDPEDLERYQTIYNQYEGSVAAPTAGLHFTQQIFKNLEEKKIHSTFVTLHVGAGTFKPVKAVSMQSHEMHAEWIDISINTLRQLAAHTNQLVAVGTTSLRTLETLYWLGIKLKSWPGTSVPRLAQWDAYDLQDDAETVPAKEALKILITWMESNRLDQLFTQTQLLIAPGYRFRVVNALVTNFHQPQSTLLLLVAAAIGEDWRKIYKYALENDFRFLSYGDGNLLFIDQG